MTTSVQQVNEVPVSQDWQPHVQVGADHYTSRYDDHDKWLSYYWQIEQTLACKPRQVLEIGGGHGLVAWYLRKNGVRVFTADIDTRLGPSVLASVTQLPFRDNAFDVVICCDVLEHMPFESSVEALREIHRITARRAVFSVPHYVLSLALLARAPILHMRELRIRIPVLFGKPVRPGGEHYWELGRPGYPVKKLRKALQSVGFKILQEGSPRTEYSRRSYLLEKSVPVKQ